MILPAGFELPPYYGNVPIRPAFSNNYAIFAGKFLEGPAYAVLG
jgi:hypothetical protein